MSAPCRNWDLARRTFAGAGAATLRDARAGCLRRLGTVLAWLPHQDVPRVLPLIGPRTAEQFEGALPALDVKLSDGQRAVSTGPAPERHWKRAAIQSATVPVDANTAPSCVSPGRTS